MDPHRDLLAGGGEIGERIRNMDWAATPLGASLGLVRRIQVGVAATGATLSRARRDDISVPAASVSESPGPQLRSC
jgi:hypothetical protein